MRKSLILFTLTALVALPLAAGSHGKYAQKDLVATAIEAGSFKTLVAAIEAAGLADDLQADGPFTVFAPSDAAFAKLPEGTVDNLLKPENLDQLRAILTYHVLPGKVMAASVTDGLEASSLNGKALSFDVDEAGARVGNANIVTTDVAASNGVIHVIDTVLIPAE